MLDPTYIKQSILVRRGLRYRRARIAGGTYFFTVVTESRQPLLAEPANVDLLLKSIERVQGKYPFTIEAHVVLPDHLHAIWTMPDEDSDYSLRWRLIKEAFTRAWLKDHSPPHRSESRRAKGEQSLWQRRFWEHTIRDDDDLARHIDYVHWNLNRAGFAGGSNS